MEKLLKKWWNLDFCSRFSTFLIIYIDLISECSIWFTTEVTGTLTSYNSMLCVYLNISDNR